MRIRISNKTISMWAYLLPAIYLIGTFIITDINMYLTNVTMALSLFIFMNFVYDNSSGPFTMRNLFWLIFIVFGFYIRYYVVIIFPDYLTAFAPIPMQNDPKFQLKTAFALLLFLIGTSIGCSVRLKRKGTFLKSIKRFREYEPLFNGGRVYIVYFVCYLIYIAYSINNIRISTQISYGIFDNMVSMLLSIIRIIAYSSLVLYFINKKKKNLLVYLSYAIYIAFFGIIEAWKGQLLYEVLFFWIIASKGKKVKIRYLIIIALSIAIVFPSISMLRENMSYGLTHRITMSSIINYNSKHNVAEYMSERFAYYDETYYVVNVNEFDLYNYRTEAGTIVSRFLSGLIPRVLWKDKPIVNEGRYITYTLLHYPSSVYNNLSVGMISDAFLSYGLIGIFLLGFLIQKLINLLDDLKDETSPLIQGIYLALGRVVFGYMEGDIAAKTIGLIMFIIVYILLLMVMSKQTIRPEP